MSTKTSIKRIALALVVAVGFGVLGSVPATKAAILGETLTIDSATDTAYKNETATAVLTHNWGTTQSAANTDTATIKATCSAPTGGTCPTLKYWLNPTSDTANTQVTAEMVFPSYFSGYFTETAATVGGSVRATINVKAENFGTTGTYVYTFYTLGANGTTLSTVTSTWTITVSNRDSAVTSIRKYVSSDLATAHNARKAFLSASDSAITAAAGLATTPVAVGYGLFTVANAAGETRTANAGALANTSSGTAVKDTLTVTVAGPGLVTGISAVKAKSATVNAYNGTLIENTDVATLTSESITIWSDGTAGTSTISVSNSSGVVLSTISVIFTGTPASAAIAFSDTIVSLGAGTTVVGTVKDSGGNVMTSGTVYIYSTDTSIAGTNLSTNVFPTTATAYTIPSTGVLAFTLATAGGVTGKDTGVATITLRDSWTVAASTWSSNAIEVTVTEDKIATLTVAFDKATYAPGERAVITYTAKDSAGRGLATAAVTGLTAVSNATLTNVTATSITGTNAGADPYGYLGTSFRGYMDTGVETRVVTMPTYGGKVTLTNTFATFGSTTGGNTSVVAEATVVDPNSTAIAAAQAAATAAADAATDAALEAIDAANAATDAANLAAEAADAATVAAEEARDAADAATAAVEALATEVATLMAALKAQITTLARTVAKIAKKVNA